MTCIQGMFSGEWQPLLHFTETPVQAFYGASWLLREFFTWSLWYHHFFCLFVASPLLPPSRLQCIFAQGAEQNKKYFPLSWKTSCDWTDIVFPLPLLLILREVDCSEVCSGSMMLIGKKHILSRTYSWACRISLQCYRTGKSLDSEVKHLPVLTWMSWILNLMLALRGTVLSPSLFLFPDCETSEPGITRSALYLNSLLSVPSTLPLVAFQWIFVDLAGFTLR